MDVVRSAERPWLDQRIEVLGPSRAPVFKLTMRTGQPGQP